MTGRKLYPINVALFIMLLFVAQSISTPSRAGEKSLKARPIAQHAIKRTIIFPPVSIGGLYLVPTAVPSVTLEHEIAVAKGKVIVEIPPGAQLVLKGNAEALRHPTTLDSLDPNAIDVLQLRAIFIDDDDEGLADKTMVHVAHLTGLKRLVLITLNCSDVGMSKLKPLKQLQELTAQVGSVNGSCFKELLTLSQLEKVDLTGNSLKPESFHYLCQFPRLECLEFSRCNITGECLKNMSNCTLLSHLNVSFNPKVDDAAIKNLVGMKSIQHLDLVETAVTPNGISQLKRLKNLRVVIVSSTFFPASAVTKLHQQMPLVDFRLVAKAKRVDKEVGRIFAPMR